MNINVPNLINAALPERDTRNRNAIIISQNSGPNHNEQGWLSSSFPRGPRKLFVAAESDDFDAGLLRAWQAEGFEASYIGLGDSTDAQFRQRLAGLRHEADLGPCETFGVVAFGEAASLCLEFWHHADHNPDFKLAGLVAHYPGRVPDPRGAFPGGLRVLVHLVGDEIGVVNHSQIVGIQGKRRVVKRAVAGVGVGGVATVGGHPTAYPCYRYDAPAGFAEGDLEEYDPVAAELAWSRSLGAMRTAFRMDVELEGIVEKNLEGKFYTRSLGQTMSTYTTHKPPHATYFPTLTGGVGAQELRRFYADYFLSTNPSSTKLTLISRTAGADRVVDELHVSFKHTQEMPWILPGVPPTNRRVEVAVVSIVTVRGGKLYHEHVYWDQASVLVQVGLLDPKLVPEKARAKGARTLPVVGREAARRLLRGFEDDEDDEGEADNELLPGWYDDDEGEEEDKKETEKEGRADGVKREEKERGERNGSETEKRNENENDSGTSEVKEQERRDDSRSSIEKVNGDHGVKGDETGTNETASNRSA